MKKKVDISHLLPCPVVLLTSRGKEKRDAMTATCMFVSEEPPLLIVSVDKKYLSYRLIEEEGEFVLNIAAREQVKEARVLGAFHGDKVDKFSKAGIRTAEAKEVAPPLISGSYASIECKVVTSHAVAGNIVYLAQAVNVEVDNKKVPLAWWKDRYFALSEEVR